MRTTLLDHTHPHPRPHVRRRRRSRVVAGAVLAVSAALTTAACGTDASSGADSGAEGQHGAADVAFAQDMLLHHAQALEMVDLTEGRELDPEVQDLAGQIEAAQEPEIDTFTGWLEAWGEDVPDPSGDHAGHDMGSMSDMPGMMTSEDMAALEDASDAEFEDRWLEMMIEHHEGAVEMARTQVEEGEYQPAVDLAESIATSQQQEIATMRALLS